MHSMEDTNYIIHGKQAINGTDEWWPLFFSWQRRSREKLYTITTEILLNQRNSTALAGSERPEQSIKFYVI